MPVKTNQIRGRRTIRYESYDDLLTDAERLADRQVRSLGNWSQGQIYKHLADSFDSSIDGAGFALPAPARWLMSLLMKQRFLTQAIPAGFSTPSKFVPPPIPVAEGLDALHRAIARQSTESQRVPHPAFGKIPREEWDQFNLRHAELHMSFLLEGED